MVIYINRVYTSFIYFYFFLAENLQLRVSKLKENYSLGEKDNVANNIRDSHSESSSSNGSMAPSWSPAGGAVRYENSSSINSTPSPHQGASFASSETKNTQRLPSFDYMQNINNNNSNDNRNSQNSTVETLNPMSSFYNNNNNTDSSNEEDDSQCVHQRKLSNDSSSSSTSKDNKKSMRYNNIDPISQIN
jgi:hypothetical protein